ncbi:hypothetical protein AAY473_035953 [Plecturocebus cupreus]
MIGDAAGGRLKGKARRRAGKPRVRNARAVAPGNTDWRAPGGVSRAAPGILSPLPPILSPARAVRGPCANSRAPAAFSSLSAPARAGSSCVPWSGGGACPTPAWHRRFCVGTAPPGPRDSNSRVRERGRAGTAWRLTAVRSDSSPPPTPSFPGPSCATCAQSSALSSAAPPGELSRLWEAPGGRSEDSGRRETEADPASGLLLHPFPFAAVKPGRGRVVTPPADEREEGGAETGCGVLLGSIGQSVNDTGGQRPVPESRSRAV